MTKISVTPYNCSRTQYPRKPLLSFRLHCEYSPDSGHVELLGAIVAIDTVLLLLDIGQLCIAETADALGHGDDSLDLSLQPLVEVLHRDNALAVAPRLGR